MSSESIRGKISQMGPIPGLSDWHKRNVLLFQCSDIDKQEFLRRVNGLHGTVEELFQQSLPESMETETYLVAKEYYDAACDGLDCYLSGLEALLDWVETGEARDLEASRNHFAKGDKHSQEIVPIAFETQESFKDTDEALMKSMGLDPEGIN